MYSIRVEDSFAAAHFLTDYHGKCERLHGHNYKVRAFAKGEELGPGGMLLDFGRLKSALRSEISGLDHSNLNDFPEFQGNPSAERIAKKIHDGLRAALPEAGIYAVEVFETETSLARYGDDAL
jgi:6-pyruvoyltetrahydropterin/6-carboxytetrahydropterin synthase